MPHCARLAFGLILTVLLSACGSDAPEAPALFVKHDAERTGVSFENRLAESAELNILNYLYYYNGGGVAVGDLNGDDRPDLYFTANEGPNRLYLNRGGFRFEDVTEAAGVAGTADWTTGVALADVNGDGRLDLYVSVVSGYEGLTGHNQLYVNQGPNANGIPTFSEESAAYGLDHRGFSTQAAFFDYDRDGDLDLYLLNHSVHTAKSYSRTSLRSDRDPKAGDKLFRNDGERFTNVSREAGIIGGTVGYGLGVIASDLDTDGCPDLYVANDFHENDYLYYNNCDGTFTQAIQTATGHTSEFSMGVDAGDVNNDGRPDVVTLDMLPRRTDILQTAITADAIDVYDIKRRYGYHHQFARNALHLNQGNRRFSDVAPYAGVHATDWSWAPLFADFDHDGRQDLFISNGIFRRPNDLDYVNYVSNQALPGNQTGLEASNLDLLQRMPQVRIPNAAFRNDGDLQFTDRAAAWGLQHEGFSNGAAYADLDADGDLDLVTNNINEPASVYENRADSLRPGHSLTIRLEGDGKNPFGIGARVTARTGSTLQMREHTLTRGYQSSVAPGLHLGLGEAASVDTLTVTWPDGRVETRSNVPSGAVTLHQADARPAPPPAPESPAPFVTTDPPPGLDFAHRENPFSDFDREALMPHELSMEGPALAVGDVNGDGRDDVYAGGAKWQSAQLYLQQTGGRFTRTDSTTWEQDARHEDVDAAFFDADGDGDLDLFVVSGGNEFWGTADALQHRLYRNDGTGRFTRDSEALPDFTSNGGAVAPADVDGDGDVDLFIGSRVVAREYGALPTSALWMNDGTGTFTDATPPVLQHAGMVSDAAWTDVNGDDRLDLVAVGTWMPVSVYLQTADGGFTNGTSDAGLAETGGWWNAVHPADVDNDGDVDLIAGNLGRNTVLHARPDEPARLYRSDFDDNGDAEGVVTYYRDGKPYPLASRMELLKQIDPLRRKFPTNESFGGSTIDDVFTAAQRQEATVREAHTFASMLFLNQGDGTFEGRALPPRAQLAPMYALHTADLTGDGALDVLMAGTFYGVRPRQGRYDASYGVLLRGDGTGGMTVVPPADSGIWVEGQARQIVPLRINGRECLLVGRNDRPLQLIHAR